MTGLWAEVAAGFRPPAGFVRPIGWEHASLAHHQVEKGSSPGQTVLTVGDQ
jgi:hypothetical protein